MIDFTLDSWVIDRNLGLPVTAVEAELLARARALRPRGNHHLWGEALHDGNQTWVGLHPETLQTPYAEIRKALELLNPKSGEEVVDLGAGYGRVGFALATLFPEVKFLGIEFVPERVAAGNQVFHRLGRSGLRLECGDLTEKNFELPKAAHYFIYDFGKVEHIRRILERFSEHADHHRFTLVARGQGIRSLIEKDFPWLIETHRRENFSLYQG